MIVPLRDFIVVTKEDGPKTTASGLYMPTESEKVVSGTVLAVGSGRVASNGTVVPMEVKVGDKVAFNRNFATELKSGGETVLLLREDQLLAVLK